MYIHIVQNIHIHMSVCLMSLPEVLVSAVASTASVAFVVAVVLVAAVVVASV